MTQTPIVRIATRRSPLAVWQAEHVAALIEQANPGVRTELIRMTTQGDRILDTPLAKIGGKGLFVKELEVGLLNHDADLAVHSMKDVPVTLPDGLHLVTVLPRANPYDAFVANRFETLDDLPTGAVVGTSSLRRQLQIARVRPDLDIQPLRGNINSRLSKLDNGDYDAIILAAAGLERIGFGERIRSTLPKELCLPAIGQGILAIESRQDDTAVANLLAPLHCDDTWTRVAAERALNHRLNGGCQVPIAGFAELEGDTLTLEGLVGHPSGEPLVHGRVRGNRRDAAALGVALADDLLRRGAREILHECGLGSSLE